MFTWILDSKFSRPPKYYSLLLMLVELSFCYEHKNFDHFQRPRDCIQYTKMDELLSTIVESIDSTSSVIDKIEEDFSLEKKDSHPELIKSLLKTLGSKSDLDSVSLLSLKNSALLGYVTDLALLLALRMKSIKEEKSLKNFEVEKDVVLESTVTNRVILEKGIKSLEKKINYQLEKMVSAYHRREKEQADVEEKLNKGEQSETESGDDDEDDDEEDEEEGLNFKPNPSALLASGKAVTASSRNHEGATIDNNEDKPAEENTKEKYRPPKIAATAIADPDKEVKGRKQRNLQSMDEYLQDISEAPSSEKSIGSSIINNGRDIKSKKQLEKEADIQRYEEENFTRLPATKTKEDKRARAKRMRNEFFGEDWSMFENNMDLSSAGGAKKRKRLSAWERAKRKID